MRDLARLLITLAVGLLAACAGPMPTPTPPPLPTDVPTPSVPMQQYAGGAFAIRYPAGANIAGEFTPGELSVDGETIELRDAMDNTIQEFAYDDEAPWATEADGGGKTLEVLWEGRKDGHWFGLTDNYVRVFLSDDAIQGNQLLATKLVALQRDGLRGELATPRPQSAGARGL